MLERLFTSKTRVAILNQFVLNSDLEYHIRGMSRLIQITPILVQKELKNLEQLGILKKRRIGQMVLYSLNRKSCIIDDLKRIFLKTEIFGAQLLADLDEKDKAEICFALIYGSFTKGVETTSSDIDLLVVGSIDEDLMLRSITETEEKTGRQISLILWTEKEFAEKIREKVPLVKELVKTDVIMILGDPNEFRRLVKQV